MTTITEQRNAGKDPVFVADKVEGLPKTQCWHTGEDDLKDVGEQPVKEYFADAMEAKPLEQISKTLAIWRTEWRKLL